jgi:uncharacterized protein
VPSDPLSPSDIFECRACGECCNGFGGTYVTEADIDAITTFTGIDPERFKKDCCRMSGHRRVLAQGDDGYCCFCEDGKCAIHPVKPRMCRAWPFIESVVRDPENWQIMAGFCPGMRTDFSPEAIRACVARVLKEEKASLTDGG